MTQPAAPCGRAVFLAFARIGLNFAINPMVASRLMKRPQFLLVCAMTLASCRRNAASMPDPFDAVIGAWHRTSVGTVK